MAALCIHEMVKGTCALCAKGSQATRPQRRRAASEPGSDSREKYRKRYRGREETFDAYLDVFDRLSGARQFPGGFTTFTRAAAAEPSIDNDLVRRAEELMRLGGYETEPKVRNKGRRWWKATPG